MMKHLAFVCGFGLLLAFCSLVGSRGAVYAAPFAYIPGSTPSDFYQTYVIDLGTHDVPPEN
jgi:hypothetical protein